MIDGFDVIRFWSYAIGRPNKSICWIWNGGVYSDGYGGFNINKKTFKAHRIAYEIHTGKNPGKFLVCHSCDVPLCVNPFHLFKGTPKQNAQDMVSKNRSCSGSKNGMAKLSKSDIIKIRSTSGKTHREIAEIFNVSSALIYLILARKRWR